MADRAVKHRAGIGQRHQHRMQIAGCITWQRAEIFIASRVVITMVFANIGCVRLVVAVCWPVVTAGVLPGVVALVTGRQHYFEMVRAGVIGLFGSAVAAVAAENSGEARKEAEKDHFTPPLLGP